MAATFPFTAITGQEMMRTALMINAVDPTVGGVLVRGQKGTAKSTAARALAALLPEVEVVAGCPYHCNPDREQELHQGCRDKLATGELLIRETVPTPFIELPLSATEDRLVGTLHLGNTLQTGQRQFEPGLLAAAHRGILYVDEVNLLPDHLVDLLLDVAVSGTNLVEREGLQFVHPARFILIGTMNPEEGELRPQLLDRFGLCVTVDGLEDPAQRREIVRQRIDFEHDPESFLAAHRPGEAALRQQVQLAQKRLNSIVIPTEIIDRAVAMTTAARTQGHRAELALVRAARALAALLDRQHVSVQELAEVAGLCLAHRFPGSQVLSNADVAKKVAELVTTGKQPGADSLAILQKDAAEDDLPLLDNIDFPGSAAAGSTLFTYLKKKLTIASSKPTISST